MQLETCSRARRTRRTRREKVENGELEGREGDDWCLCFLQCEAVCCLFCLTTACLSVSIASCDLLQKGIDVSITRTRLGVYC